LSVTEKPGGPVSKESKPGIRRSPVSNHEFRRSLNAKHKSIPSQSFEVRTIDAIKRKLGLLGEGSRHINLASGQWQSQLDQLLRSTPETDSGTHLSKEHLTTLNCIVDQILKKTETIAKATTEADEMGKRPYLALANINWPQLSDSATPAQKKAHNDFNTFVQALLTSAISYDVIVKPGKSHTGYSPIQVKYHGLKFVNSKLRDLDFSYLSARITSETVTGLGRKGNQEFVPEFDSCDITNCTFNTAKFRDVNFLGDYNLVRDSNNSRFDHVKINGIDGNPQEDLAPKIKII
jgi:hypothetical protein